MLSVLSGHTDCVYSLLNKGANVEAKDKWGRTALHRGVSPFTPNMFYSAHILVRPFKTLTGDQNCH